MNLITSTYFRRYCRFHQSPNMVATNPKHLACYLGTKGGRYQGNRLLSSRYHINSDMVDTRVPRVHVWVWALGHERQMLPFPISLPRAAFLIRPLQSGVKPSSSRSLPPSPLIASHPLTSQSPSPLNFLLAQLLGDLSGARRRPQSIIQKVG